MNRSEAQKAVGEWCEKAFGKEQAMSIPQRGIRLLEEAIELYQACGCSADMAHKLVDHVFSKPVGTLDQEIGGISVALLQTANAAKLSIEDEEEREVLRVLSKPLAFWKARNANKNALGFKA